MLDEQDGLLDQQRIVGLLLGLELRRRWCAPASTPALKSVSELGFVYMIIYLTYLAWCIMIVFIE